MLGKRIVALCSAIIALGGVAAVSAGAGTPTSVVAATAPGRDGNLRRGNVRLVGRIQRHPGDVQLARDDRTACSTGSRRAARTGCGSTSRGRASRSRAAVVTRGTPADRLVAAANARGIHLLAMVAYTPSWNRPSGTTDHYQPTDPTAFAEFVRAAAQRYAPQGLHAWEIWNEPNMRDFWQPVPSVARYTQLLKLGSAAIHSVDPAAFVVSGGVAPALNVARLLDRTERLHLRRSTPNGGRAVRCRPSACTRTRSRTRRPTRRSGTPST